jgi:hypothetical protein
MNTKELLNQFKIFFLISGIVNILYALGLLGYTFIGGLITCGLGCLFGALPIVNVIAAVMDFISYNRLDKLNRSGIYSTIQFAAIFDIVTIITGNIVSFIFGIIILVNISKDEFANSLKENELY